MAKKIYVNGGIVIATPYFKCPNSVAYIAVPPKDSTIIEPNRVDDNGYCYLEISEENPQSIFNEYFAKYEFAYLGLGAGFLHSNFRQVHEEYIQRNRDIFELIQVGNISGKQRNILNRLCFVSIVASLEAFVCDIILTRITEDELEFKSYFDNMLYREEKTRLQKLLDDDKVGHWEQKVMEHVLKSSFSNIDRIKRIYSRVFGISLTDYEGKIKSYFYKRHLFAHRNGREKDGRYILVTCPELEKLIEDTEQFAQQILDKILKE
jgi:hypothetical protein